MQTTPRNRIMLCCCCCCCCLLIDMVITWKMNMPPLIVERFFAVLWNASFVPHSFVCFSQWSYVEYYGNDFCCKICRTRILRHLASELNLNVRSDGFVMVNDLLKLNLKTFANISLKSHTIDDIREVSSFLPAFLIVVTIDQFIFTISLKVKFLDPN